MALSATEAEDVTNVSATLARKRAPAFYFEQIEDESTAQEAAADAHRIHRICMRLVAAIESELPEPNERPPERTSAEGSPESPPKVDARSGAGRKDDTRVPQLSRVEHCNFGCDRIRSRTRV